MTIAEAFLGALFNVLLDRLASSKLLEFLSPSGIDVKLKKWRRKLLIIESVLDDAENKQTSNRAVREWLNELEQLAYDIEDLVDKLNTERTLMETKEASTSKVQNILSTIRDFISDCGMDSKLNKINDRLEELVEEVSLLRLETNVSGRSEKTGQRLQPTSVVEESEVHGREGEKEDILNKVLGVESTSTDSPPKISVIPIVGMGGLGKTTLAQLVYNDDKLKCDYFDLKAWACVSDEFDVIRVTKTILKEVSSGTCDSDDFNMLQVKLKESLSNKRFLVVLDDVWGENLYEKWEILRKPFLAGKPGSKIIVTTRLERVAQIMSDNEPYHLNLLSDGAALSLLAQHSLKAKTFDERPDLRESGMSVVRRCKNLPLAVKAIGGLLRTTDNPKDWEHVVKSDAWVAKEEGGILPALKLSYKYLPSELKRCFAYCALFPKDYEFDKFKLEILWMAEGFVQDSEEYSGSRNFDELLSRSFFQQSSANRSRFVMHDLHNDLAMFVAGDKCLRTEYDAAKGILPGNISEKVRHLSIFRHSNEGYYKFNFFNQARGLRTFLSLPIQNHIYLENFSSQKILLDQLPNLDHIRVLSLACYWIKELPNSVGELKQLRYLDLANTKLRRLPESLTTLINLKVLILRYCNELTKLPANMENIFNLCHLDLTYTDALHEMPPGIGELTSLHTLSKVIVSESGGMRLNSLGNLSHLQGQISIEELQNVVNVQEAKDARLIDKQNLDKISLSWSPKPSDSLDDEILQMDVLNALKPHENLSSLDINCYGGTSFSNWIGDPTFSKLASISFYGCRKCTNLPPLGQLHFLRELHIRGMSQVKVIGGEFYGNRDHGEIPFPSLETLELLEMPDWEDWLGLGNEAEGVVKLPRLRILSIEGCPKLVRLPILSLPSLRELHASRCDKVVLNRMLDLESLTKLRLQKISGLTSIYEEFVQFPFTLENLEVVNCNDLETLWTNGNIGQSLVNLRQVVVRYCPRLLQVIDVLPALRTLYLDDCAALEFSPNSISCLEKLTIADCPSLKMSTALHDSSTTLESLIICSLVNLNMTNLLGSVHSYSSLTSIYLSRCDGLESFPDGGLPTPNLRSLEIRYCRNLKSLPYRMDLLSSLQDLVVYSCPSLIEPFPQGNVPPNLTKLSICECGNLKSLGELHKLTSLQDFTFSPSDVDDDDDQHYVLPPSLTRLQLFNLRHQKTLPDKCFQNLTSLRHLEIGKCPKLVALPMEDQLGKLSRLLINGCPLLTQRCLKNKGDYWPIIANIPQVIIDNCHIHDDHAHQDQYSRGHVHPYYQQGQYSRSHMHPYYLQGQYSRRYVHSIFDS